MAEKPRPRIDLLCPQGKTFRRVIAGRMPNGDLWDLTGWTARVEIRTILPYNPGSVVIERLTTENGGLEIQTDNGESKIILLISAERAAEFPIGNHIWELEIENNNGFVPYLMAPSRFKVVPENTL